MTVRKLEKTQWRPYFDRVLEVLIGKRAEIEVDRFAIGAQIEAEWLLLLGIAYNPKTDLLEIELENLDHMIRAPQAVYIDDSSLGLTAWRLSIATVFSRSSDCATRLMLLAAVGGCRLTFRERSA